VTVTLGLGHIPVWQVIGVKTNFNAIMRLSIEKVVALQSVRGAGPTGDVAKHPRISAKFEELRRKIEEEREQGDLWGPAGQTMGWGYNN